MRKKRLSILLALIMVVTLLPMNTEKVSAASANAAKIGDTEYATLQDAVDAVTAGSVSGSAITLLRSTGAGPSGVTISGNKNFTIDLNGYTLDGGTVCAIQKDGSGTLTITGGVVTSQVSSSGTITVVGGSVIVLGGTVQNTSDNGRAIFINLAGSVSVAGGTIQATGNQGRAILNTSSTTSRVTLTGGTVKAVNNDSYAIVGAFSIPSGTVEIMGSFQASDSKPILSSYSDVQIKANTAAASESGAIGINSAALDGTGFCNYKYLKFTNAKITTQLVFDSTTESQDCTNTSMHAAHIHADGRKCWAWDKDTATLTLDGIDLDVSAAESAIRITVSNAKLILKGNNTITLKDSSVAFPNTINAAYYGLEISGNGSITINGSNKSGGTSRTVSSGIYTNQKLKITGGTITVSGGTVSTTGNANGVGSESNGLWGYGGVEITGGTVNAIGGSVTFDTGSYGRSNGINRGTGGISLSGGTVTAQAMSGYQPFYSEPTLTGMVLKAGTGTWNNTTGTACTYEPGSIFTAVADITMTNATSVQVNTDLTLAGTAAPSGATNKTIVWSVQNANGTGATIVGNTFRATTAGTATIKATVTNGSGISSDYTKNFTITVTAPSAPPFVAVTDITMTNANSVQANIDLTLAGTVTPSSATNKTIVWSVQNANGTGAKISGNTFRATAAGTATIKATVVSGSSISSDYTKNIAITVTAPPSNGDGNTSSGNNGTSTPAKTEGKIEKDQKLDEKAPQASLKDSTEDLKAKVLSALEQEQLAMGKDVKVILKVEDISASVSAEDKKLIEQKLATEQKNVADVALLYVDISLFKKVGDAEETRVTETSGKIKISIEVPESMWSTETGADRTYRVIRMHNGVAEILNGTYDPATHLFTFETDRFSTYALTYQDENTAIPENNAGTSDQLTVVRDFNHLCLTAEATKTSQKLTYAKVSEADGYLIYGVECGQELKKLADVEKTVTSYTANKLKKGTYYKYQVKAYRLIDGKQVVIMASKVIHSVTEGKTYANPTKVTVDTASVKLATEESKTLTCQVVMPEGKKLKQHTAAIRYESSNKKVATVNSKGKIVAKAKGTCYVYAYAQNGVYIKIKVTVK